MRLHGLSAITQAQIGKLIGTTKSTINNVRDRSHWNSQNIKPVDPVTLGLCSQIELDEIIAKSADKRRKIEEARAQQVEGPGLETPAEAAPFPGEEAAASPATSEGDGDISADDIFKNFSN